MGINNLPRNHQDSRRPKRKARLAALCALLPGMGAVYNRQNIKAIVHFITIVGLFQLTDLRVFEGLFSLAGVSFYVYSIIDAYRTALSISQGESPSANEDRFKKTLAKRAPAIGIVLIVTGLLSFIQIAHPLGIYLSIARLLPVGLIILGGYLLTRYFRNSREESYSAEPSRRQPFALVPGPYSERESENARTSSRPFNQR